MRGLLGLALTLAFCAPARAGLPDAGFAMPDDFSVKFVHGIPTSGAIAGKPAEGHEGGGAMGRREAAFRAEQAEPMAAPDVSAYAVRGIDVSHYEGAIDWPKVKAANVSFVYAKATEGGDYVDDTFKANWTGADGVGIHRGAYHFWNFCRDGASQAANFIKTVPVDASALPMTIDLEESPSCSKLPAKAKFRKDLSAFVSKIKAAYHKTPIIYINYSIYEKYFAGENDSYPVWIADIRHVQPQMPGGAAWTFWQYNWHASVAGINGEVDVDVFNGAPVQLAELESRTGLGLMLASLEP